MYRALYRKWRPAAFADVVGQTGITTALQNQLLHDKVGHAYLFTGTRGTGKTTCAKIFAKAVNCPARNGADPCNACSVCKGIDNGSVLDVVEIDAASNNGVDNIRDLRDETAYTPSVGKYKVYIIDEVHMLSTAAFNALLKIMEEPPSHVIFILATTEIHKVPATILSRCQRYDFTRISPEDITGRLQYVAQNEGLTLEAEAAGLIARLADGAMRDALSILDTCAGVTTDITPALVRQMAGVTDKSYLFELGDAVQSANPGKALELVATLREKSIDIKRLCDELILHYRNLLLAGVSGNGSLLTGVSQQDEARYVQSAANVTDVQAVTAIKTLTEALDKMGKGTDPRIELELALFQLCVPQVVPVQTAAVMPAPTQPAAVPTFAAAPIAPTAPEPVAFAAVQANSVQPNQPVQAPVAVAQQPAVPSASQPVAQASATVKKAGPMEEWPHVVTLLQEKDPALYPYLKTSKAFQEGKRVLIDGSDFFLEYIRANEQSRDSIKNAIFEVTGQQCSIGPYPKAVQQEGPKITAADSLAQLSAMGVEVVHENEK